MGYNRQKKNEKNYVIIADIIDVFSSFCNSTIKQRFSCDTRSASNIICTFWKTCNGTFNEQFFPIKQKQ